MTAAAGHDGQDPAQDQILSDEHLPARSRSRRFRALGRRRQLPPRSGKLAIASAWILLNVTAFACGAFFGGEHHAVFLNEAYLRGIEILTGGHLMVEPVAEVLLLALLAVSLRSVWLIYRVVFVSGPIEVRQLDNASGMTDVDVHQLDVAFREYVTLPHLYQVTTIPGDREPEDFIAMFEVPASSGWRAAFAAAYSYALPKRAFIVSAALRHREAKPRYGVSVQVRNLLGPVEELETQWSSSFERALERAAYAVGAYILPQTRRALNAPWAGWIGRELPVSLFRDYQRAKRMVAERRYDEALALYRQALAQDAGNIAFRFDVGQLFERLALYPDALGVYVQLVNEIFPPKRRAGGTLRRQSRPRWRAERSRDPYIIRYRYIVSLSLGRRMAEELCLPQWDRARVWIRPGHTAPAAETWELRPWRVPELTNLQHILSHELERLFPDISDQRRADLTPDLGAGGHTLLGMVRRVASAAPAERTTARREVERYLLECAVAEARLLIRDFSWWRTRRRLLLRRNSRTRLTLTAMRMALAQAEYRLKVLTQPSGFGPGRCHPHHLTEQEIHQILTGCGFDSRTSASWLEQYNAACFYAVMLDEDEKEDPRHQRCAYAAVLRLERALELGEEIAFARTKRYWLQAGDPDLAGLRRYSVFRAFEARIYGTAFPEEMDLAKYELYVHLRELLKSGAGQLEAIWRHRIAASTEPSDHHDPKTFEQWWSQEEHAWEITIRLGRFYRQWQTRQAALEALRNWIASYGIDADPVPYPNLSRIDYIPDINELANVEKVLSQTEKMLDFLGHACGTLHRPPPVTHATVLDNTRAWRGYAEQLSRATADHRQPRKETTQACQARAAVWAALRQWATTPDKAHREAFRDATARLPMPPAERPAAAGTHSANPVLG